jgi:protein subunit release factor A
MEKNELTDFRFDKFSTIKESHYKITHIPSGISIAYKNYFNRKEAMVELKALVKEHEHGNANQ